MDYLFEEFGEFVAMLIVIIGILAYFIPAIIGYKKKHSTGILLLNLFLGWTFLGWIGSLVWAVSSPRHKTTWTYTCPKCGLKHTLQSRVNLFVCPNCHEETEIVR